MPAKKKAEGHGWRVRPEIGERHFRQVDTRVWEIDERTRTLTDRAMLLWMFLITNHNTTSIPGLFRMQRGEVLPRRFDADTLRDAFTELTQKDMVEADWDAGLVWVKKASRHSWPTGPNAVASWRKVVRMHLPECPLLYTALRGIREQLQGVYVNPSRFLEVFDRTFPDAFWEPSRDTIPKPIPATEDGGRKTEDGGRIDPSTRTPPSESTPAHTTPTQLALPGAHLVPVASTPPAAAPAAAAPRKPVPPPRPVDEEFQAGLAFWTRLHDARTASWPNTMPEPMPAIYDKWYSDAVPAVGGERAQAEDKLLAGYRLFLRDDWAKKLNPPGAAAVFIAKECWRKYVRMDATTPSPTTAPGSRLEANMRKHTAQVLASGGNG